MDAERLERAARALVREVRRSGALPLALATDKLERSVDAIEAALAAQEPAPATGAVADAAIKAKAQGFDRICLRCLCGFSRTDECPRCQPTGSAQAGEAVAWQIVDHNYGPTHYFGMTEDDAWARMVKASGEGRSVWARTRFARPLYAAPSRPGGAARAAALEEAAKVCEGEERRLESHGDGSGDAEECARLIRAIAGRGA